MSKRTTIVHMMDAQEKAAGVTRCGLLRKNATKHTDEHQHVTCPVCLRAMVIAGTVNHLKAMSDKDNAIRELKDHIRSLSVITQDAERRLATAEDVNKRTFERAMKLLAERNALLQALVHASNKADHGAQAEPFLD